MRKYLFVTLLAMAVLFTGCATMGDGSGSPPDWPAQGSGRHGH